MTTEFAWVIERGDSQPHSPTYWAGPMDYWSQDHMDAVRFVRKQDAERVAMRLGQGYHRVAEHGWHFQPRPHLRDDSIPTRADIRFWIPAEHAIAAAMQAVEAAGASEALTDAVTLLGKARDCVADHVEGGPLTGDLMDRQPGEKR